MNKNKQSPLILSLCLQRPLTKIIPHVVMPSVEISCNFYAIWHKSQKHPLEKFPIVIILLCISLAAIWSTETTHWTFAFEVHPLLLSSMSDFLGLSQFATDSFWNLQIVRYFFFSFFCGIAATSCVQTRSLGGKNSWLRLAWQDQTKSGHDDHGQMFRKLITSIQSIPQLQTLTTPDFL